MKSKLAVRFLLCALAVLTPLSVMGVWATWIFAQDPANPISASVSLDIAEFTWEGSEVLPDDVEGEDHAWLINNLISGEKNGTVIGLDNKNSDLNEYINNRLEGGWGWKRDYFGSMAVTGDDEMEALFGAAAQGLSFIVQVVSDTEYYIYTTSVYLGERGAPNFFNTSNKTPGKPSVPIGEYIYAIFRTKLTRASANDPWDIVETKAGKAKSDWYDENRTNANVTQIPAFDINTWVEAVMGEQMNTSSAIWTFIGDDPTAYPATAQSAVYYRITPASAGARRVYTYNTDAVITIYNASGTVVATSQSITDADGAPLISVSWTGAANTLYYISVTGDTSITLKVE